MLYLSWHGSPGQELPKERNHNQDLHKKGIKWRRRRGENGAGFCSGLKKSAMSSSVISKVSRCTVVRSQPHENQIYIPITIWKGETRTSARALVDSGTEASFVSWRIAKNLPREKLEEPLTLVNIDLSTNQGGKIWEKIITEVEIAGRKSQEKLLVANIGTDEVVLGMDWLKKHNPDIHWTKGMMTFQEGERLWVATGTTWSQRIAEEQEKTRPKEEIPQVSDSVSHSHNLT